MAEAKEPGATYGRKPKDQISRYYKTIQANDFLQMSQCNRVIASLVNGPLIMAELRRCCNGYVSSSFYSIVNKLIESGKVEKLVNGHTLYSLTPEGLKYYKQLKKQAKNLFFK